MLLKGTVMEFYFCLPTRFTVSSWVTDANVVSKSIYGGIAFCSFVARPITKGFVLIASENWFLVSENSGKSQGASFVLVNGKPVVRFICLLLSTSQCILVTLLKN